MRRVLYLSVPVMLICVLGVVMVAAAGAFPVAAQNALDQYLRFKELPPDQVLEISRAKRPWNLAPGLKYPSFGESSFFLTDVRYNEPTPAATPVWYQYFGHNPDKGAVDRPALPAEPEEVWCVQLQDKADGATMLFLALYHSEPYQTDWIVIQGPSAPLGEKDRRVLAEVGCQLPTP